MAEDKNCFRCEHRVKINPEEIQCRKSGKIYEETFGLIVSRPKDCPLEGMDGKCNDIRQSGYNL